jgi:hypothetical protein
MGWASKRNGDLLRVAEHEFDVFSTVDQPIGLVDPSGRRFTTGC